MEKQYTNYSARDIVKRQGAGGGMLRILEFKDPGSPDESLTFFIEIETSDKENERITRILSEELKDQFFNAPTDSVEFAFENALSRANISIKDTLLIKPKNWLNKIHVAVLACKDQEVHLSSVGNMHAYLAHREQIVDVLSADGKNQSNAERGYPGRTPNPVKLFSNIVSGRLLPGDALVLVNESVLDYLSPERIRKTARDFDPALAINKLHELLFAAPANKQFGVVIIKRQAVETPEAANVQATSEKMQKDIAVEKYLKPEITPTLPIRRPGRNASFSETLKKAAVFLSGLSAKYGQIAVSAALNALSKFLEKTQLRLAALAPAISKTPTLTKTLIRDAEARKYYAAKSKQWFIFKKQATINYFQKLPWRQKRVLAGIVGLVIILTGSVYVRIYNKNQAEREAAFKKELSAVAQQIDQTEASLLYNDQTRARETLAQAAGQLTAMSPDKNKNNAELQSLQTRITDLQNRLEKKTVLNELTSIATLNPPSSQSSGLILTENTALYYNGQEKQLIKVDLASGLLLPVGGLADIGPFKEAVLADSQNVVLLGESAAVFVNIAKETTASQEFVFPPNHPEPFTSYARNLYTFSAQEKNITRYREGSLSRPENWQKQDYDLPKSSDIAVDGSLYLLSEDGKIHVFGSGFSSGIIDLALAQPLGTGSRLYLNEDTANFYILDSINNRLLRFTRKGEYLGQYVSAALKEARDLIVPKGEKEAYILAGDKIYRLPF